jgi:hypothetical protein
VTLPLYGRSRTPGSTWHAEQAQRHRVYLMTAVFPAPLIVRKLTLYQELHITRNAVLP